MRIIGDDDAGRWRAELMDQPQRAVNVLEHADGVGDHDVIERTFYPRKRRRLLDIVEHEGEAGMPRSRALNRLRAEVDADTIAGFKRGEQIARAAAELQHPLARRYQEAHVL